MAANDVQHEAMRVYQALVELCEDWGGELALLCGSGCVSGGAPAAVSIAGGAMLAIDSDAAAMKAAMRAGYLDFVVNTLDEALRALKNQVRMRRPLGVGLIAEVDGTLAEMVERGVEPDLQLGPANYPDLAEIRLDVQQIITHPPLPELCNEYFFAAANAGELAALDASLLARIGDEAARRRWIQRVPRYLREARGGGRWIWLSDEERERLILSS